MLTPALLSTAQTPNPDTATPLAKAVPEGAAADAFGADLLEALSSRPRVMSPKYFYDAAGSRLFDQICELQAYYPTRTECGLLARHASEMAALAGPGAEIVEFGAGSLRKVQWLLDAFDKPLCFMPIDISGQHLAGAAAILRQRYAQLPIEPVVADYSQPLALPPARGRRIGFFPGSTLGNFAPAEAVRFLRQAARCLAGGALIVGVDLVKDPARLHAAYNDAEGVTAAFNLNLLARANRELGADFQLEQFFHSAFYNAPLARIEMHLVSRCQQRVRVLGQCFEFAEGETLHTENSYKFTLPRLHALAASAGLQPGPVWTDPEQLFAVQWLQVPQLTAV